MLRKVLVLTMLMLAMTVSVVYTADAVIEDEDEDTNPQAAKPAAAAAAADDDDYVPSEEEAAQEDEDDDDLDTQEMKVKPTPFKGNDENRTLRWDKRIIELDADDFDYWTTKFDALFVMIYAPWCGHCKDFAEKYDQVGQDLFDNSPRYFAAKIDGHKYPEIFRRYDSQGFPHLLFFKRGKAVEYVGKRETKPIVDYVKKEGPDKVQLLDCGQLIEQKRRQAQMVVYFGASEADSRFLTVEGMSKKEHRFNFFWNNEPECWKKHNVESRTITFMTNFDGEGQVTHVYTNSSEVNYFASWLLEPQIPPLVMYDEVIGETMRQIKKPTVILFRNEEDEFEDYVQEFRKAALANRGKAIFIWADKEDHNGNELAKHMKVLEYGLDPGGPIYPSIRIMSIYHNKRWISPVDPRVASVGQITEFLDSCIDFKAEEFLPSKFHDNYFDLRFIKEPSGRRFHKQIQAYAHVDLVMFLYSPTCKHCEMYGPKYLELAKLYANRKNIEFWEMDAVNNMVLGLNINQYPTVLFWPSELRNSTTQRPWQVIDKSNDINVVMSFILEHSAGLLAQNFTFDNLISEEEQTAAKESYRLTEIRFNETIKNETMAKEAKELKEKTDREEAYKKQKEQEKLKKEQEEEQKKMMEEKKKIYEKSKEGAADQADEGNNIEKPVEVAPSSRIPGKKPKQKAWVPGERKFDEDGNELFEQKVAL